MANENSTNGPQAGEAQTDAPTEQQSVEAPENGTQQVPEGTEPPTEEKGEGLEPKKLSYEDLESALKATRNESAGYRQRAREAEDKLKNAKTPEEVAAIVADMTSERESAELALTRKLVAAQNNLPDYLANKLAGSTLEEMEADAKELAKFIVPGEPKRDPKGGLDPTDDTTSSMTAEETARFVRENRY